MKMTKGIPVSLPLDFIAETDELREIMNNGVFKNCPMNRSAFYRYLMRTGATAVKAELEKR